MLQSMGLQRFGHDCVTELTEHQQEFTGGSDCRCVRNSKRTRVRSVTLRCDWIATISWKNFNRWGVASYWWVNKVVSWERSCSWWRCCEDCWNDNRGFRILHKFSDKAFSWTWVWVNSGCWWWTGRPGVLQKMGSQRVRHYWETELTDVFLNMCF